MKSIETEVDCKNYLHSIGKEFYTKGIGCNGTFDSLICWEATAANTTLFQKCPEFSGIFDTTRNVLKNCLPNGHWEYDSMDSANVSIDIGGKTDYIKYCLSDSAKTFQDYLDGGKISSTMLRINRYVELTGLCLSLICICVSLFIFLFFKVLRCNRTKIHINLFFAILIQIILRLIIYVDELAEKSESNDVKIVSAIGKYTQGVCQSLYIILQYSLSSMFMWMLIEGVYLNILLMYSVFDDSRHKVMMHFYIFGWGLPVFLVLSWTVVMITKVGINEFCWLGYDKMSYYWILQGPRFIIMTINVFCLINVIRVLVTKLRENKNTETQQIRKSLRAAILLLPLLGIAHVVNFFDPPKNPILYTIMTIVTSVFQMYQGVFVSFLYCFLNNEVKAVLHRFWVNKIRFERERFKAKRNHPSMSFSAAVGRIEADKFIAVDLPKDGNNNNNNNKTQLDEQDKQLLLNA